MATESNLNFRLGETWVIAITCEDAGGTPLALAGADVRFRLATPALSLVLDLAVGSGVSLGTGAGMATITVTPAMQVAAGVTARLHSYEIRAELADGTVSDQAFGSLNVRASLFSL